VWSGSRFRYTGQIALPELKLYHYKARAYSAALGRFLQTDPIGFAGGMNMYAYVGNDPVNATDPMGLDNPLDRPDVKPINPNGNCNPTCVFFGNVLNDDSFRLALNLVGGGRSGGGGGAGGGGGGTNDPDNNQEPPKEDKPSQCSPTEAGLTLNLGLGVTGFLGIVGGGASGSFTAHISPGGLGYSFTGSGALMLGYGAFVGVGAQAGAGYATNFAPVGVSVDGGFHGEAGVGWGPSAGASIDVNHNGSSGSGAVGIRPGAGLGGYIGGGPSISASSSNHFCFLN
jgi:RHS repeat-associated protein